MISNNKKKKKKSFFGLRTEQTKQENPQINKGRRTHTKEKKIASPYQETYEPAN